MTAEVAILNRIAVALAADSAVSIGDGDAVKIYQSENKIFELSTLRPTGLMIYNSTQYFGIPWEIIIKDFRKHHGNCECEKLFDIVPVFTQFLMDKFCPTDEQQEELLLEIIEAEVEQVYSDFVSKTSPPKLFAGRPPGQPFTRADYDLRCRYSKTFYRSR